MRGAATRVESGEFHDMCPLYMWFDIVGTGKDLVADWTWMHSLTAFIVLVSMPTGCQPQTSHLGSFGFDPRALSTVAGSSVA